MNQIHQLFPWLEAAWLQLNNYIQQERIPQALLITGNAGMGKQQLAEYFARSVMCSSLLSNGCSCGKCQSCRLFDAETHPDYIFIQPEAAGKAIGISVIRQLVEKLSLKPQFEGFRVVIVNPADGLNNAAANAFLKCLEEPTERSCLILITDKPSKLAATIKSRCQKLLIPTADKFVIFEWLEKQGVTEQNDLFLSLSRNAPLLAKQFSDVSLLKLRTDCFDSWIKAGNSKINFVEVAERWHKLDRTKIDLLMFWIISWVIDIVKLANKPGSIEIYNPDLVPDLQELAHRLDLKQVFKYYDFLLLNQKQLDTQLNKQLMFEEILIQWLQLNDNE